MQTVPNIDRITSYSRPGTAVINVYLQDTVPVKEIKQRWLELRNIVNDGKGDLPDGALGPFSTTVLTTSMEISTQSPLTASPMRKMRVVAENIKDKFFQIPDVKKVELVGVQPEKIYIQMSNAKLAQLGIPIDTLASTIQAETAVTPSGMAESDSTNTYLRLTGSPDTLANISNIPIQANDRTFRLGDIAEIKRGYAEPAEPKMYFNGQPAVGIAISRKTAVIISNWVQILIRRSANPTGTAARLRTGTSRQPAAGSKKRHR